MLRLVLLMTALLLSVEVQASQVEAETQDLENEQPASGMA